LLILFVRGAALLEHASLEIIITKCFRCSTHSIASIMTIAAVGEIFLPADLDKVWFGTTIRNNGSTGSLSKSLLNQINHNVFARNVFINETSI
jgi:hypothetical protein